MILPMVEGIHHISYTWMGVETEHSMQEDILHC